MFLGRVVAGEMDVGLNAGVFERRCGCTILNGKVRIANELQVCGKQWRTSAQRHVTELCPLLSRTQCVNLRPSVLLNPVCDPMITIVDYQMGNLRSVQKAIERVGGNAKISSDPNEIADADKLILPGVGAFGDAMDEINRRKLADPIRRFVDSGRPFLGICLGLQLLFERGFEHGEHQGLGILPGDVIRFDIDPKLKVPHMGWNTVRRQTNARGQTAPILDGVDESTYFYFVHSYFVRPTDPNVVALTTDYGGDFCAMVWRDNVYATQFHPEKSQADGLKLLGAFNELSTQSASV